MIIYMRSYDISPDNIDINEKSQEEMIGYVKKITHEISEKFQGSEKYIKVIDDMKDLNSLIVHLAQFMPMSNAEKYDLLETQSLKDRSLKFMDYLLKQKEAVELQIQLAEKFSKTANKNYREAVLQRTIKSNSRGIK